MKPERRRTPRTNLDGLAYINFEPDNGGIVLNISEEGLCFHSVSPVQRGATLPFSLSMNGDSIEAVGVLTWTDEHRKTGGLRFNGLAPDARRRVRSLIDHSSRSLAGEKDLAARLPDRQRPSTRFPNPAPAAASAVASALSQWFHAPLRWGDFSRGLAAGLLVALFVAAGFSFDARRRQIGSFLIRLGEQFEATSQHEAAPQTAAPGSPTQAAPARAVVPAATRPRVASLATGSAASTVPPSASATSARRAENLPPQPAAKAQPTAKTQPPVRSQIASTTATRAVAPRPTASSPSSPAKSAPVPTPPAVANSSPPPSVIAQPTSTPKPASPVSSPAPAATEPSSVVAKAADQPGEGENAEDVVEINSGMPLGKYFDVGKFKEQSAADGVEQKLIDAGFRSIVLPKSLLWMKSYQVLVGPYRNDQDAEGARRSLQSQGYKPRSLARRSRQLTLVASYRNPLKSSEEDSPDSFVVTWEVYSALATVKFVNHNETKATAVGKWVALPAKSDYTAITYTNDDGGKRTLLEIQFRGMSQAVLLPTSSARTIVF